MNSDRCECGGVLIMSSAKIYWEAYCDRCGRPVYLDDDEIVKDSWWPYVGLWLMILMFLIGACVDIPL